MCEFCNTIFDLELLRGKFRSSSVSHTLQICERTRLFEWKGSHPEYEDSFLFKFFDVYGIWTGDLGENSMIPKVRYCPYCGEKIKDV